MIRKGGHTETLRIMGKSKNPVTYSSTPTRTVTIQGFMGGAEFNEVVDSPQAIPGEMKENLEKRFNSGVNRTDMPRMWGHMSVDRHLGKQKLMLADELAGWRRQNGEVLYKK